MLVKEVCPEKVTFEVSSEECTEAASAASEQQGQSEHLNPKMPSGQRQCEKRGHVVS